MVYYQKIGSYPIKLIFEITTNIFSMSNQQGTILDTIAFIVIFCSFISIDISAFNLFFFIINPIGNAIIHCHNELKILSVCLS